MLELLVLLLARRTTLLVQMGDKTVDVQPLNIGRSLKTIRILNRYMAHAAVIFAAFQANRGDTWKIFEAVSQEMSNILGDDFETDVLNLIRYVSGVEDGEIASVDLITLFDSMPAIVQASQLMPVLRRAGLGNVIDRIQQATAAAQEEDAGRAEIINLPVPDPVV